MSRILFVGSSGGHLAHLIALRPWWAGHERAWVTFEKPDAVSGLAGERLYWCYYPTNRNARNLVRNSWLAFNVLRRERPAVVVSAGAAVAVPFFYLARLFGAKTVFIEVVDRVTAPTLTARLVYPVSDLFLVQWPSQAAAFPRARVVGRLL